MDIIEHNEYMELLSAEQNKKKTEFSNFEFVSEQKERDAMQFESNINNMHRLMSKYLTPLAADYWRKRRYMEFQL